MHPSLDPDPFSDTDTNVCSPPPETPPHAPDVVFVVKTLASGETAKYRVHCDPNATLAALRDTLQKDEDCIMSADDRFHHGDFRVGTSAERHTKWRDVLHGSVIGILPKTLNPSTSTKRKFGGQAPSSSSSLPPATVPLHLLSGRNGTRLYGNFEHERDGYSYNGYWKSGGIVCRIWETQGPGMVPFRRVWSPKSKAYAFPSSNESTDWWIKEHDATIEYIVGYVYRCDSPCPAGAIPFYGVAKDMIGRYFTISEGERDLCLRLGAEDMGVQCYVAPP